MINTVKAEFMKLKRNKIIIISELIVIFIPLLMILKDLFQLESVQRVGLEAWIYSMVTVALMLIYPVISGFFITYIIQREYGDQTIINALNAQNSRFTFLMGKLLVWGILHICATLTCLVITLIGVSIIFSSSFQIQDIIKIVLLFIKCGILNFISLMPLLYIVIKQKKVFYPSLLFCILFSLIGASGLYMPTVLASVIPWSAVLVISYSQSVNLYCLIGVFSIIICGIIGIINSFNIFKHQEL